jgi:AcrR family transcriptional regulator
VSSGSGQKSRPYRLSKRAEQIDDTRLRIVEATVALHGTVGPARTTIMGIAQRAGVTRATVYRHFPDEPALFEACSAHWFTQQVPPDPSSWTRITDPVERTRTGLTDIYRFYRAGEPMLTRIHRDKSLLPDDSRHRLNQRDDQSRDLLLAAFPPRKERHLLRAVLGHAVAFWTWRSLCIEHGLENGEAVSLMVDLVTTTARPGLDRGHPGPDWPPADQGRP